MCFAITFAKIPDNVLQTKMGKKYLKNDSAFLQKPNVGNEY